MGSFSSSVCYLDQEKKYEIEEASDPVFRWEESNAFSSVGGWVFWVPFILFLEGYMVLDFGFKSTEEDLSGFGL